MNARINPKGSRRRVTSASHVGAVVRRGMKVEKLWERVKRYRNQAQTAYNKGDVARSNAYSRQADALAARLTYSGLDTPVGKLPNPTEYRTVDTTTLKGLKEAERLQAQGWLQGRVGPFTTQFYRVTIKKKRIKANPAPSEWDDETLNEAARLGSAQARALGKSERASRAGLRFFNVTWFSPARQKRVGFIRPIEAMSASDAKRQAKAMVTNEKAINIVAKPTRRNGDAVTRRNPKNPGIMEIAGGLQALDYLGEKVGVGKAKRTRRNGDAETRRDELEAAVSIASARLQDFPRLASGLVSDSVRKTLEYRTAKTQYQKAFRELREFNQQRFSKKKNPSVNEMSERFQGRATGKTEDYYFSDSAPRLDMSRGGKLVFLKLKDTTIRVPASVVAIDPKSEKLWLGSKSATGMFKRKASKGERLDYGDIDAICYLTAKTHIGKGKQYEYIHTFGEDGGRKPRLLIDHEGMPILQGGDYKIEDRGIVN